MRPRRQRARRNTRHRWLTLLMLCVCPAVTSAQSVLAPVRGFGWDLELDGGVGFGLQRQLENNFVGRLRVGALYFDEPIVYALGVTSEVGGLADYGVGLAFEASHFDGPWARIGGSRVARDDWMTQLMVGYLFFGLEWQHRFDADSPVNDALMLVFRLPVGVWWFMMREQRPMHGPLPSMPEPSPPPSEPDDREHEEAAEPHAVLRLRVEPLAQNDTVWLDDQPFSVAALGYPYEINPGTHVIVVKRGDVVLVRLEISAEAGGNVSLKVDPTTSGTMVGSEANEARGVDVRPGAGETAR